MKLALFAVALVVVPAFGSTLTCQVARPGIFNNLMVQKASADANEIVVEGASTVLGIAPGPDMFRPQRIKYSSPIWNTKDGLSVSAMSGEMTTGQHGSATIRLSFFKPLAPSPATYMGTLSLLPSSMRVMPRVATTFSVRCLFRK